MNPLSHRSLVLTGILGLLLPLTTHAQIFGNNLIQNPGAEEGLANTDPANTTVAVPGWTVTDRFTVLAYDPVSPSYGTGPSDPGPTDRGLHYFFGGTPSDLSTAVQSIDLTLWASAIEGPGVRYELSGWLGGWQANPDHTTFTALFRDGTGNELASATLGPVTVEDRSNQTGLWFLSHEGLIPRGTVAVDLTLTMTRLGGVDNDGLADNLFFTGTLVPEPRAMALTTALALLGVLSLRALRHHRTPTVKASTGTKP